MRLALLILVVAWPPEPPPRPRAPNAFARGVPFVRFDARNLVDRDPARTAAVLAFVAAADAMYRADLSDAELERWCAMRVSVFELERKR